MPSPTTRVLAAAALALALLLVAAAPASAGRFVRGIDVSRFQAKIDWSEVAETKTRFAYVQASRGSGSDCLVAPTECGPDRWYGINYAAARANGIQVGPYHRAFVSGERRRAARRDARREARVFIAAIGELEPADLLPVLDVETPFVGVNDGRLRHWITIFSRLVKAELGAKPIIYTNNSSWEATADTTRFADRGQPLWVANFGVSSPLVPASNWGGLGWKIWQFTSTGRVRGVKGSVDKNKLRGALSEIQLDPSVVWGPPEPEPGDELDPALDGVGGGP